MVTTIELEHAIGYAGHVQNGLYLHPNNKNVIYPAGACVVKGDRNDPHEQEFLRGHDDHITCIELSSTGKYIASGQKGENADVCVWDFEKSTLIYRLAEHEKEVVGVAFTEDEKLLMTCGGAADNRLLVWDMSTGYLVASAHLPVKNSTSQKKDQQGTIIAWGGKVRDIKRRETNKYQLVTVINRTDMIYWILDPYEGKLTPTKIKTQGYQRVYTTIEFDKITNEYIIAGSTTGDISIASIRNKNIVKHIPVCSNGVRAIKLKINNQQVIGMYVAGGDGTMTYLKGEGYQYQIAAAPIKATKQAITSITNTKQNEEEYLIGSIDGNITEMKNKQVNILTENHYGQVTKIAIPYKVSDRFATASEDKTVRFWDLSTYKTVSSASFSNTPTALSFVSDVVFIGFDDGTIRSMDTLTGDILWDKPLSHRANINAIQGGIMGRNVASADETGLIRFWSIRNKQLMATLSEHTAGVTGLTMFNKDRHMMSCSKDRSVICWDLEKMKRIVSHEQQMGAIYDLALYADETRFMTVGANRKVTSWDLRQSKPTSIIDYQPAIPTTITISNDNQTFAVGGTDETVHLYDVKTQQQISKGEGHSDVIRDTIFTYDDKQLISVGDDGCIFIWNQFHE